MCQFHVDNDKILQEISNEIYAFGGTTSHLIPPNHKPLIIFGQDEAILINIALINFNGLVQMVNVNYYPRLQVPKS